VTAGDELLTTLEPLSDYKLMTAYAALDSSGDPAHPDIAMRHVLCWLADRWLDLHAEIKMHTKRLKALAQTAAPALVESLGIGPNIAGELLAAAGDNTDRVRSEAAFAKLCGACPSRLGQARPAAGTGSTEAATAKPTLRSTAPSSSACAGTRPPSPTSSDAPPKASPRKRSFAAGS
jgi:transposase